MKVKWYLLLIVWLAACDENKPVITGLEGQPLPDFSVLLAGSSTILNTMNLPPGKSTVIFYFKPDCPFCQVQIKDIVSNAGSMENIRFYFVSQYPTSEIAVFTKKYGLDKHRNMIVGQDFQSSISNYFQPPGVPYMAIYGPDKNLNEVFLGNVPTRTIREAAALKANRNS